MKPEDYAIMIRDFRRAVGQDCMGWFCEKYGFSDLEFLPGSSLNLIALVARKLDEVIHE